jgi:hypothetical protein
VARLGEVALLPERDHLGMEVGLVEETREVDGVRGDVRAAVPCGDVADDLDRVVEPEERAGKIEKDGADRGDGVGYPAVSWHLYEIGAEDHATPLPLEEQRARDDVMIEPLTVAP